MLKIISLLVLLSMGILLLGILTILANDVDIFIEHLEE